MIVYKFGGASVSSASGVRRVFEIVAKSDQKMVVVISAMGKTTNKMEIILENIIQKDFQTALELASELRGYHEDIIADLGLTPNIVKHIFEQIESYIKNDSLFFCNYEQRYDSFVSFGEMLSSTILSSFFTHNKLANKLLDVKDIIITDSTHRDANVDFNVTRQRFCEAIESDINLFVTQGFISSDKLGNTTTLGREGSDYTAAIIANVSDSDSVTIWKDVDGVFNADPREFKDVVLIPQLPYAYAVELAHNGAQIIHPKTIKPLENKNIPLYVKPFKPSSSNGTIINNENIEISVPIFIKNKKQNLVSIRPKDLSFVLEHGMEDVMSTFNRFKQKIYLIQISAVSISISTGDTRYFEKLIETLREKYNVYYNTDLEILTIKNYTIDIIKRERENRQVYIEQKTRTGIKILRGVSNNL